MEVVNVQSIPGCFNVAIVIGRCNQSITQKLLEGTLQRLRELKFHDAQITEVWVPGIYEIPLTAQRLARSGKVEAIICLGVIINDNANQRDYLFEQAQSKCQHVSISNDLPIICKILATETVEQAHTFTSGANSDIGRKAADTAFELISVLRQI